MESAHQMQKIDRLQEYGNNVHEMLSSISTIATNNSNARVQEVEQQNEKEKAALDKRLKAGLSPDVSMTRKLEKMDELRAEERQRKRASRRYVKELAAFQIVLNTAAAIMKIWAEVPKMDFGVSTVALTAVAGAYGRVTVGSRPVRAVTRRHVEEVRFEGARHEQGAYSLRPRAKERIVAARPAKAFPNCLTSFRISARTQVCPIPAMPTKVQKRCDSRRRQAHQD